MVAETLEVLRSGGLVAFPTETVYGLMVDASNQETVERLYSLKGRDPAKACSLLIGSAPEALEHVTAFPPIARRLAHHFWPGPLTLVVPGDRGEPIGFRLPDLELPRALAEAAEFPIIQTSANQSSQPPALDADSVATEFGEGVDLLLDGGASPGGAGSTVVGCDQERLTILRPGVIEEARILEAASEFLLLVCTGNLCRSPLAEALMRRQLARRLGCAEEDLPRYGFRVASCGTMAQAGIPATEHAISVGRELGVDISEHASQRFRLETLRKARHVFGLSQSHLDFLASYFRSRPGDLRLLDPEGESIPDPYQRSLRFYREVSEKVRVACEARARELVPTPVATPDEAVPPAG